MAVGFLGRVVRGTLDISGTGLPRTNQQTFTSAGFTATAGDVKGAVVVISRSTTDDTLRQHAAMTVGFASHLSTTPQERTVTLFSEDNVSTSNAQTGGDTGYLARLIDPASSPTAVECNVSLNATPTVTDGLEFDVNWTLGSTPTAYHITVLLLGGDDCELHAGHAATSAAIPGTNDVTTPGFEPDFVLTHYAPTINGTLSPQMDLVLGIAANDGSDNNANCATLGGDNQPTQVAKRWQGTDHIHELRVLAAPPSTDVVGAQVYIDDYDANGFSFNNRISGVAQRYIYLAVKTGTNVTMTTGRLSKSTTPPDTEENTWPGHLTGLLITSFGTNSAQDTIQTAAGGGIGFTDRITDSCHSITDQNNAATANTSSLGAPSVISVYSANQVTHLLNADWNAENANGFQFDWPVVTANRRYWVGVSIQEVPQDLAPDGIATAEAIGTHVVTSTYDLTPDGIASAEAIGTPTITTGPVTLEPDGIASEEAIGTHVVTTGAVFLLPDGIASAEAIGTHLIALEAGPTQDIICTGIATAEAIGNHLVQGLLVLPQQRLFSSRAKKILFAGETMIRQNTGKTTVRQGQGAATVVQKSGTKTVRQHAGAATVRQSHGK